MVPLFRPLSAQGARRPEAKSMKVDWRFLALVLVLAAG
jgi:hypothetical protein